MEESINLNARKDQLWKAPQLSTAMEIGGMVPNQNVLVSCIIFAPVGHEPSVKLISLFFTYY